LAYFYIFAMEYSGYNFTPTLHHDIHDAIDASKAKGLAQPGKVILITGAGRGIGRAIAIQYAHASVASLIIISRTSSELESLEKEIKSINSTIRVHRFSIDVSNSPAVHELARTVQEKEGRLDVLVNNAGYSNDWVPLPATEPNEWWKVFNINLNAPYLFTHAFQPLLAETAKKASTKVHIINITSIGAHIVNPVAAAYGISKLALVRLSETVDAGHRHEGIVCIAIHPGGVPTTMSERGPPELLAQLVDKAELAGGFTAWLTANAEDGKEYLAGRYVSVNWDVAELEGKKDEIVEKDLLKVRMAV
jgi:NAD(P)-dependent dehydrogenase (short-subunit alcohol dehydrogenase family)